MKIYIYSSNAKTLAAPYLFLAQPNATQPPHPSGKTWAFWKEADLSPIIIGVNPVQVAAAIAKDGYYIH